MPRITVIFGVLLILLGCYGYFGSTTEHPSPTALIPAGFGLLLSICGAVAAVRDSLRRHMMHISATVALLGALAGGGRGVMKIGSLFSNDPGVNTRPVYMTLTMAVLCLMYVIICVQSFIAARQRQRAEAAE
jgi:hypothetical protein